MITSMTWLCPVFASTQLKRSSWNSTFAVRWRESVSTLSSLLSSIFIAMTLGSFLVYIYIYTYIYSLMHILKFSFPFPQAILGTNSPFLLPSPTNFIYIPPFFLDAYRFSTSNTYKYIHIPIYICVCVCNFVLCLHVGYLIQFRCVLCSWILQF